MKKIIKAIALSTLMFFSTTSLSSCFGFFEEEVLQIANITTTTLENGNIQVKIIYSDEEIAPTTFVIPKGNEGDIGKTGNGIKEVTTSKNEEGNGSIITITYTDETMEPTILNVSDGVSIKNIESSLNEEKEEYEMNIILTDGTTFGPLIIPKGKDGNSILGIKQQINIDNSVTLTIKTSNGEDYIVQIPAPQQGEDGRGIKEIVSVPNGDQYVMTITYTDDTTQVLEFARPNKWFSEIAMPSNEDGINGDLWYDLAHNTIYVKQNDKWNKVIDLSQNVEETFTVRFDLNDNNEAPANMPAGSLLTYEIESSTYFASSGYSIPVPAREGYQFEGWYTVKNPTAINGKFTDLTPVCGDLTLYANWTANE